jgi:hypothetical protein
MANEGYGLEGMTHRYRSHAEGLVGDLLDRYGLPFVYEKPTAVLDNGQVRIWYPDFTLAYGPIIEYFGMYGNADYDRRTEHKLKVYRQNQFDVVPVYSRDLNRGWEDRLLRRIDDTLESRLGQYRSAVANARTRLSPRYASPPYRRH